MIHIDQATLRARERKDTRDIIVFGTVCIGIVTFTLWAVLHLEMVYG